MEKESYAPKNSLRGVLLIYIETGYEGSGWAFQDEHHISKVSPSYGIWGDETVWDSADPNRKGKTRDDAEVFHNGEWHPLPDPIQKDPDYVRSSLYCGEAGSNREADKRLMDKYGFIIKYAADRMNERYGEGNWRFESPSTAVLSDGTRVGLGTTPDIEPNRPYGVSANDLTRVTVKWSDGSVESRLSGSLLVKAYNYIGLHILENGDRLTVYDKDNPSRVLWKGIIQILPNRKHPGIPIQMNVGRKKWCRWFLEGYPATLRKIK